jgi:hypothetical protein
LDVKHRAKGRPDELNLNLTIRGEFILQEIKKAGASPGTTNRPSLLGNADAPSAPTSSVFETLNEQKIPSRGTSKVVKETSPSKFVWIILVIATLIASGIFIKSTLNKENEINEGLVLKTTPASDRLATNSVARTPPGQKSDGTQVKVPTSPDLANVSSPTTKETATIVDQVVEESSPKKNIDEANAFAKLDSRKKSADDESRVATLAKENRPTSTQKKKNENAQITQDKASAEKSASTQKITKPAKPSKPNQEPALDRDVVILSALVASDTNRTPTEAGTPKPKKPATFEQKLKLENQWYGIPERKNQDTSNPLADCKNAAGEIEKCPAP